MYIFINKIMKLALIIITSLLVGCFASSVIKYDAPKSEVSIDIDKKIEQLKQEQEKLKELQKSIDKQINEKIGILPPTAAPRPPVMSAPPRFESDRYSGGTSTAPPKIASIDSVDARLPSVVTTPKLLKKQSKLPDNYSVAEQLYKANAVFAVPERANIKEDIKAQLIIDPTKTLEEIKKDIKVGSVREAEQIKISKIVIAKLNAPDFEIISSPSIEQAIIEDGKTEWIWGLRPKTPGLHPINLIVEAQVIVGSRMTPHLIRTFDKQVMIEITTAQTITGWWNRYWQWVIATLLLPLGKWLYSKHKSKKDSE